ncbi:hypothetical protein HY631_04600 [Candidatus Uhrbacteria bacterium]|nr:hypothetical protein [Candidatus Uhrbacteria bacterium]
MPLSSITPGAMTDAAATIRKEDAFISFWLHDEWTHCETYLEWAQAGLQEGGDRGFAIATSYAKQAVCRRIDCLLLYNHLLVFQGRPFPEKMRALTELGINVPSIVHRFAIAPRNTLEHDYQQPSKAAAENSVELADLLVRATQAVEDEGSIAVLNTSFGFQYLWHKGKEHVRLHTVSEPCLLIASYGQTPRVVLANPVRGEALQCLLTDFSASEAIEFAKLIRSHRTLPNHGNSRKSQYVLNEITSQMGFAR